MSVASPTVLALRNLSIEFVTAGGVLRAVDDVCFEVEAGETLVIIGESGSGKSSLLRGLLRLHDSATSRTRGQVLLEGEDLMGLSSKAMAQVRGGRVAMIFQDASAALDPYYTVGDQIAEALTLHRAMTRQQASERAISLMAEVGIAAPESKAGNYPHQLSGGMQQRLLIAMAIACEPTLLLADEPTSALDVTTQAQILELLKDIQRRTGTAVILVTHDLGIAAATADRVAVMYGGQVVEYGPRDSVLGAPQHPYTRALMAANVTADSTGLLKVIPGEVPDLHNLPSGCRFASRCELASDVCLSAPPPVLSVASAHSVRCTLYETLTTR
jgi:oligopeptide/dipeptide ABC transporter ATP-binding protein